MKNGSSLDACDLQQLRYFLSRSYGLTSHFFLALTVSILLRHFSSVILTICGAAYSPCIFEDLKMNITLFLFSAM